jgi:hypothetical protein
MAYPWKKCAGCPQAGYNVKLTDGLCVTCQTSRKSIAEQAALEAKVETYLPVLMAHCDRLAAFHAYLLAREDGPADDPAPATRWSRLPEWRRNRPERLIYDDGADGEAHVTR